MKTMFGKYIVLFAALQVFLGCENILEPPKPNVETGSFSLTINEANTGRTILPQTVQDNFTEYKLEFFTAGEITNPLVSISRPYTRLSEPVLLGAGTWDLYVTAYLEDQEGELKPAAQGNLLGIGIGTGEAVNGSVTLEPIIDSGEGTFSWNIVYPANVTSAKMTIHDLNEGREGYNTGWYFIGEDPLIDKEGSLPLEAGYYRVVFELLDGQGRSAARREILHIYHNMESSFSCEFTDSNFLVEPLKAILAAWDEGWTLNQAGITADHFIVMGIDGIDDNNFDDIADWLDNNIDSPAADLSGLKVLVDVALVGIAGNDDNFCDAGQYTSRTAVETAIRSLVKNGTSVVIEWEQDDTVHIRLGGQHSVTIILSDVIPFTYTAPANVTVNDGITASVTFNPASPRPAGTQITATVNFTGTAATEKKYIVNLTSIKASLSGNQKTKTVSAGTTHTSETFYFTVPSQDVDDFILTFVENEPLEGKLLILQAYGSSSDAAGVSHSFVELYNTTEAAVDLNGIGLYYADGTSVSNAQAPNTATKDGDWKRISLDGKTIPAKGSFLVLGSRQSQSARYQIPENSGDINDSNFTLSNRAFKVALLRSTADLNTLDIQNPFNTDGDGTKATGYIDMVGAANEYGGRDLILGFETLPARNSASEAVRRVNLTDTDDNSVDFSSIRYASTGSGSISNELLEVRKPRNSSAGNWNPFADPLPAPPPPPPTEKLIILQANTYGNNNGGAAGFARSLVELYNNTETAIDLATGNYYLHIGDATTWTNVIQLTGTIPAKSSFLVVDNTMPAATGNNGNSNATPRAPLPAADQEAAFVINNANFKIAILRNQSSTLSVNNPFTETNLSADYVDMLGTGNTNGFETTATSASRPQGPRRKSLADTGNNNEDFAQVDYRGHTTTTGIPDAELYKFWPRNSASGTWDPITGLPKVDPISSGGDPGDSPEPETTPDTLQGKLLILQAYGSSSDAAGVSHSFAELYNNTDAAINLNGIGLYYADGTSVSNAQAPNTATKDGAWKRISLEGKTIPAKGSFLILGPKQSPTDARYQIPDNSGDINDNNFTLSNRAFKVALIRSTEDLTVQNPFDIGEGKKILGYIDMVGAANDYQGRDLILGFETLPARNSASEAVRRVNLADTDDNLVDFSSIRYASTGSGSISNELLEVRKPRNAAAGLWDPFAEPEEPVVTEGSPKLMILQANIRGNDNGRPNSPTGGGFPRSLVELYNNTDAAIDLSNYSLHIGQMDTWAVRVPLTDKTIPAKSSFLIVSNATGATAVNATPRASLPAADLEFDFIIGLNAAGSSVGNNWKIALMKDLPSNAVLPANPFTDTGLTVNYVDMLGVGNDITGFETARGPGSAPQGPRRTSLTDTDNNNTDFAQADYRGRTGTNGVDDNQLYKIWPRNATSGAWNPITGLPQVDPQVIPVQP